MIAARLKSVRLARGLSVAELAARTENVVSKGELIRFERGEVAVDAVATTRLAAALGVRTVELWGEPGFRVEFLKFRKKSRLGRREEMQLLAGLQLELERRVRLQEVVSPEARPDLPAPRRIRRLEDAESAAGELRRRWGLEEEAPIACLTEELERRAIHVVLVEAGETFDGVSAVIRGNDRREIRAAAVVSRRGVAGERQRMNLAHELGHIVGRAGRGVDEEKAAFRFAGALLVPAAALRSLIGERRDEVSLEELEVLREQFGVSLQALVRRLHDLRIIPDDHALHWWKRFSKYGWRRCEPNESPPERGQWLRLSAVQAYVDGLIGHDEVVALLGPDEAPPMPPGLAQRLAFLGISPDDRSFMLREEAMMLKKHYSELITTEGDLTYVDDIDKQSTH